MQQAKITNSQPSIGRIAGVCRPKQQGPLAKILLKTVLSHLGTILRIEWAGSVHLIIKWTHI